MKGHISWLQGVEEEPRVPAAVWVPLDAGLNRVPMAMLIERGREPPSP